MKTTTPSTRDQPMVRTFHDLREGDTVFVVQQYRRNDSERRTSVETITKVGRKFAYIGDRRFCRDTGVSVHNADSNARANGFGFDVYHSEGDYVREQHEEAEMRRLNDRMVGRSGRLHELSPDVVAMIHAILDQ